jgi:ABC-type nitrate/sulfonate/bicarbonate transport system permease component
VNVLKSILLRLQKAFKPAWLAFAFSLVLWQIVAQADTSRARILPAPTEILQAAWVDRQSLLTFHAPTTLFEALAGLLIALVLGILCAAFMDNFPPLRRIFYPFLVVSQTIPVVAIAPLLILLFGLGLEVKIAVVVVFTIFPITIALVDGLATSSPDHLALLRVIGGTRWQIWRKARLPAAIPALFSGLRIAATYAMTGAIIGEFITAQYGLGRYLRSAYNTGRVDAAFAAIAISALISIVLVWAVGFAERLCTPYRFISR